MSTASPLLNLADFSLVGLSKSQPIDVQPVIILLDAICGPIFLAGETASSRSELQVLVHLATCAPMDWPMADYLYKQGVPSGSAGRDNVLMIRSIFVSHSSSLR